MHWEVTTPIVGDHVVKERGSLSLIVLFEVFYFDENLGRFTHQTMDELDIECFFEERNFETVIIKRVGPKFYSPRPILKFYISIVRLVEDGGLVVRLQDELGEPM